MEVPLQRATELSLQEMKVSEVPVIIMFYHTSKYSRPAGWQELQKQAFGDMQLGSTSSPFVKTCYPVTL